MQKKKLWMFVYVGIVLITLVVILIFATNKKTSPTPSTNNSTEQGGDNSSPENPISIYATSFTVNLPSTINILKGRVAELLSGYIVVQPSEMMSQIRAEIKPRYNSSAFGLELNNLTLKAYEVGTYNLTFSVPRSETTTYNRTILITVYDDIELCDVRQLNNKLIKGELISIPSVFEIKDGVDYQIEADNKITLSDGCLIANAIGNSKIEINAVYGYVKYIYVFDILIIEQPKYYFEFNNVTDNAISFDLSVKDVFFINYVVKNREEGDVSQDVDARITDPQIAQIETNLSPIIKIRALKIGETKLVLTCLADSSVVAEIIIIVK